MKRMQDEELIDGLNAGKSGREIAEEYNYKRPQRISERIRDLKDEGYTIRDTTSMASAGAGRQVSIESGIMAQLDVDGVGEEHLRNEELHYDRDVVNGVLKIRVSTDEDDPKMSVLSEDGDRLVYVTGNQLSKLGFEGDEPIFVEKSHVGGNEIELSFHTKRVVEP